MKKLSLFIMIISTFSLYGRNELSDLEKLNKYNTFMKNLANYSRLRATPMQTYEINELSDLMQELKSLYATLHNSSNIMVKHTAIKCYDNLVHNIVLLQETRYLQIQSTPHEEQETLSFHLTTHQVTRERTSDPRYFRPE